MLKDQIKTFWAPREILEYEATLRAQPLPGVPGEILEDILLPPRGFMKARVLNDGQHLRIVDVEGQQVADVLLYDPRNLKNCASITNTILIEGTYRLTTGSSIYAKSGDRLATIVEDTVGRSAFTGGFCNADLNEVRYGIEGTHSCRLNFVASMEEYGLTPLDIEEGNFSPFMDIEYGADGSLSINPPTSRAGDYFDLRADMDIIVALSNCPSEHNPCNGWNPSSLRVVIYEHAASPDV